MIIYIAWYIFKVMSSLSVSLSKSYVKQEFAVWLRKLKQVLGINIEGWDVREIRGRFKREGIYVYLWLIHVEV